MAAGAELGVANAGYYAIESLRLEKGYRAFGRELTPDYTPVEAGLVFATGLDKLDRRGSRQTRLPRSAGARGRIANGFERGGSRRRLVSLVVDDPDVMLWGGELMLHEGEPVGQVTSAAWGATVGSCVGLGLRAP